MIANRNRLRIALLLVASACGGEATVADLIAALRDPSASTRRNAALELGRRGPAAKEAVPALLAALADAEIRGPVVAAIGRIGRAAVPGLVGAIDDERVGPHARDVLHTLGESVLPQLVRLVRAGDAKQQRNAITSLLEVGPSAAAGFVQLAGEPKLRPQLEPAMRNLKVEYLRALLAALHAADDATRRWVLARIWRDEPVVGEPKPVEVIPDLVATETREGAAIGLAAMGPRIVAQLVPLLSIDQFRAGATRVFELMGRPAIVDLETARNGASSEARKHIDPVLQRLRALPD